MLLTIPEHLCSCHGVIFSVNFHFCENFVFSKNFIDSLFKHKFAFIYLCTCILCAYTYVYSNTVRKCEPIAHYCIVFNIEYAHIFLFKYSLLLLLL